MRALLARSLILVAFLGVTALVILASEAESQQVLGPPPTPVADSTPAPQVPNGVEVMARGPVHEAFAAPNLEAKPTQAINKKPPAPIEEMPPEDRPEGNVVWVGGYWSYDDDRQDFLWVSGCWRVKPENREWVPGYWREVGQQWQWVPGFWTGGAPAQAAQGNAAPVQAQAQEVTYFPQPPAPPNIAPPANVTAQGTTPGVEMFYVPGYWQWTGTHYQWRAGYWQRLRTGYVYVAPRYYWTPTGYVFVPGYWDYAVARRGVVYAPVAYNPAVVPAAYVYSPGYAVSDVLVLDAMFVNPMYGSYYFGDYYGPVYANRGYVTTVVYSRTYYEPIVVYQRYEYRSNPNWFNVQFNLVLDRNAGRAFLPPRTLIEQQRIINTTTNNYYTTVIHNTTINNRTVIEKTALFGPARTVMAARGIPSRRIDVATRTQIHRTSQAVHVAAANQRRMIEARPVAPGNAGKPITHSLPVHSTPVAAGGTKTTTATGTSHTTTSSALGHPVSSTVGTTTHPGSTTAQPGAVNGAPHTGTPVRPMPPAKKNDTKKKER